MSRIIHLIDRSRVEAREECPRLRFLNYDFAGTGLDTESTTMPLLSGIAIHAAHAKLLAGQALDAVISETSADYVAEAESRGFFLLDVTPAIIREQSALLEGMLRAWAAVRLPLLLDEYDVASIEEPWDWELAPGLVQRLRMDAILRRKDDGLLHVLDYKTVAYPSEVWLEKFEHSLQTCLYLQALTERLGESIAGICYEGLVKGQWRVDTARSSRYFGQRIQQSPYTVAYRLQGDAGTVYQTDYTSRKGFVKVRPFDDMTMKQWVEEWLLPAGNMNELFPIVPSICPPSWELARVKEQVVREELAYHHALGRYREVTGSGEFDQWLAEEHLNVFAPLRTGRCQKYGADHRCRYMGICFNKGVEPLSEGSGYIQRRPHHDTDMEMIA